MGRFLRSIYESDWKLWLLYFIYPACAALFVQLILLPYLFPQWHAGEGMLAGGDWYSIHEIASSLAEKIKIQGWSAWDLRPTGLDMDPNELDIQPIGQAPSGIAAIFYVILSPHPWVMIPLYAGLHAAAAFTLFRIIMHITENRMTSFFAVMPFWLYPSAMIWYTQLHKDAFFITGASLILLAWLKFNDLSTWENLRSVLKPLIMLFLGAFLAWLVRPYGVQMIQVVSLVIVLLVSARIIDRLWKKERRYTRTLTILGVIWLSLAALSFFTVGGIAAELPSDSEISTDLSSDPDISDENQSDFSNEYDFQTNWFPTGWPSFIEEKAFALAQVRDGYRYIHPDAGSNIDLNVGFNKIPDILLYLPRAAEIAFLSPFPRDWFQAGSFPANTVMRRVSGFEMFGVYLSLVLLPFAAFKWRNRLNFWIILIFCVGMMLIYGLVIANIGTLYRFRYFFIMTLVSLGIAKGLSFWLERK